MNSGHPSSNLLMQAVRDLLGSGTLRTQAQIIAALEPLGYTLNQSKVSRLLHKIGAIKVIAADGEISYRLPHDPAPPSTKSPLASLVLNIKHNETTIAIKTIPGAASLIARLLDFNAEKLLILGSVAGDDTILLAPISVAKIQETIAHIESLLANID